ncbi:MAG TPA: gliding motility-associated protein GldE [Bacteroidales bacterium]|nr:gliding motility-associated protein GldE [Bacteroidales bacterium]HRZ49679.1 gliding motility-associated protein GldE [Bacteroidales bacterium]
MDNLTGNGDPYLLCSVLHPAGNILYYFVAAGILILLIICSGLISASEIGFFSLNTAKANALRGKKADEIRWLWERPEKLLATILIYNNLANVSIILLATWLSGQLFEFSQPWMKFLVDVVLITSLILLLGELFPKILANIRPTGIIRFMATPLRVAMMLAYPVVLSLVKSTVFIDRRIKKKNFDISRQDLNEAINYSARLDVADQDETRLLKGIVNFGDKEVTEIMTSRMDVIALNDEDPFAEVQQTIKESGYSRYPVYHENIDNVIGILHIKDVLPLRRSDTVDTSWQSKIRQVYVIPESKNIKDLLKEFQKKKMHMAVVVDEFGGFSGIITLEDVIEEIVGEISDEFDEESDTHFYRKTGEYTYEFEGKFLINDFLKVLDLPDSYAEMAKGEADTLAGFLLELKGEFPVKGETINHKGLKFTIKEADSRRIKRIIVDSSQGINTR